jgi:DNA-binding transcriptional LysR family regulator
MSTPLDADQLRSFVAIVEAGSFTRAAEAVAKTQSAVSMQIKRLEERLGCALFERDGRQNRLTAEGERLLDHARRIVRLNEAAVALFAKETLEGHVRLGTPDDYADRFLPEILARFSRANPRADMTVVCEPTPMLAERIRAHEIDLAIVTYSCPHLGPWDHAGRVDVFRREPLSWVTSEKHFAHEESPLPLALGRPSCQWREAALDALTEAGRPFRLRYSSWNAAAVCAAVLAGLAVSVLPESALRPGMRVLDAEGGFPPLRPVEIAVLRLPGARTPLVEALAEHIVSSLGNVRAEAVAAE